MADITTPPRSTRKRKFDSYASDVIELAGGESSDSNNGQSANISSEAGREQRPSRLHSHRQHHQQEQHQLIHHNHHQQLQRRPSAASSPPSSTSGIDTPPVPGFNFAWIRTNYAGTMEERLDQEIAEFIDFVSPSESSQAARDDLVARMRNAIESTVPGLALYCFGSFATNLYLPAADMDMVGLFVKDDVAEKDRLQFSVDVLQPKPHRATILSTLDQIATAVRPMANRGYVQVIRSAKVPIAKFWDSKTQLQIDLSVGEDSGPRAVQYVNKMQKEMPQLRPLVMVLRQFLRVRQLADVRYGGIGGYGLVCWVVSFIKIHPLVCGNKSSINAAPQSSSSSSTSSPKSSTEQGQRAPSSSSPNKLQSASAAAPFSATSTQQKPSHPAQESEKLPENSSIATSPPESSTSPQRPTTTSKSTPQASDTPARSKPTVGTLFLDFLRYFSTEFNYFQDTLVPNADSPSGVIRRKLDLGFNQDLRLSIQDPINATNDITGGSYNIEDVRYAFDEALAIFDEMTEEEDSMLGHVLHLTEEEMELLIADKGLPPTWANAEESYSYDDGYGRASYVDEMGFGDGGGGRMGGGYRRKMFGGQRRGHNNRVPMQGSNKRMRVSGPSKKGMSGFMYPPANNMHDPNNGMMYPPAHNMNNEDGIYTPGFYGDQHTMPPPQQRQQSFPPHMQQQMFPGAGLEGNFPLPPYQQPHHQRNGFDAAYQTSVMPHQQMPPQRPPGMMNYDFMGPGSAVGAGSMGMNVGLIGPGYVGAMDGVGGAGNFGGGGHQWNYGGAGGSDDDDDDDGDYEGHAKAVADANVGAREAENFDGSGSVIGDDAVAAEDIIQLERNLESMSQRQSDMEQLLRQSQEQLRHHAAEFEAAMSAWEERGRATNISAGVGSGVGPGIVVAGGHDADNEAEENVDEEDEEEEVFHDAQEMDVDETVTGGDETAISDAHEDDTPSTHIPNAQSQELDQDSLDELPLTETTSESSDGDDEPEDGRRDYRLLLHTDEETSDAHTAGDAAGNESGL
ncbi:hypothetical protein HK102_004221, partial [Quaeritorhiza haematococci]